MYDFILDIIEEIVTTRPSTAQVIDWTSRALKNAPESVQDISPPALRPLACKLARMAWNVTPQPAHGLRI